MALAEALEQAWAPEQVRQRGPGVEAVVAPFRVLEACLQVAFQGGRSPLAAFRLAAGLVARRPAWRGGPWIA